MPEDYIRIWGATIDLLKYSNFTEMAKSAARDLRLMPRNVDALFALGVAMVELGKEAPDFEPINYGIQNLDKARKLSNDIFAVKI